MMNLHDTDTTDSSKYRLVGRSVLAYRFIAPYDATLYVGDIKKITDRTKDVTFFAKITDLSHDSNFADNRWDTRVYAEKFYGLGEDVFITVDAVPLGFVDSGRQFPQAEDNTLEILNRRRPDGRGLQIPYRADGRDRSRLHAERPGHHQGSSSPDPCKSPPQHMGVFATTGMGKSNFMKTFCASCMKEQKFGLLIVDPHGEYVSGGKSSIGEPTKGLVHYTEGRDGLAIFTIRGENDRKKYGMNTLYLEYDDFRISDLSILHDLTRPQHDIIEAFSDMKGKDIIEYLPDS